MARRDDNFYARCIESRGVADSFEGLPDPGKASDSFGWKKGAMAVSLDQVRSNFARYGLLDEQVVFLKGFFNDTLPGAGIVALSVLRVDADLYESTRNVLHHLYPKLSVGGMQYLTTIKT